MSQLDLALAAGVSSRHVSFIETGRATPSRLMVLRLAETLDMPLRERNELLLAAGFAPVYGERDLQGAGLEPIRRALELVLSSHEPYPAFVLDAGWNVLLANRAFERLLPLLLPAELKPAEPVNTLRLVFDPRYLRPLIADWELVAHVLGRQVQRQLRLPHVPPARRRLLDELLDYPGVREAVTRTTAPPDAAVVVPMTFEFGARRLSWFSTIATLGTPQDVTLDELRIESLFPADRETERAARALAAGT